MKTSQALVVLLYAAFMLAVIVLAVVALLPRRTPILVTGDRYPTDVVARVKALQADEREIDRELRGVIAAEDAQARELAAIRASLDHITVRVHLGAGCGR